MKKLQVLPLLLLVLFTCIISVYADGVIPPAPKTIEEQIQDIENDNSYTKQQKQTMINKIKAPITFHKSMGNYSLSSVSTINLNNFSYYYQQSTYWCVPACMKMTIQYINGASNSKQTIANDLGTSSSSGTQFENVIPYLNNRQNRNTYVLRYPETFSESTLTSDFVTTLSNNSPSVICTKFDRSIHSNGTGYPYTQSYYHSLCVTGRSSDNAYFRLHDPVHNSSIPASYIVPSSDIMLKISCYAY
ncbi:C39 family peptidase [Acetanaerobacterium elongatum]|uniref:Peptidase_C39 like family protein n=1 Tax=Acetanaerobacterium elongatum TaxID=258515 RepID=A0A1H0GF45_9FIRM|nr:C39 family peptidase [Acetanaerobacterium elongatum]SDO05496.1 Peptidase_C39 like family protein [Acetanaerobacterium elongatum]